MTAKIDPAESCKGGTEAVGEQLDLDEVDAERLRYVLVVANRHPGATEARILETPGEIGGDGRRREGQIEESGQDRRARSRRSSASGFAESPERPEQRRGHVGLHDDAHDLAKAHRRDRKVVAAHAEHGNAEQNPDDPDARTAIGIAAQ